ncbi:MAG: cation:proton antiporter [Phycisphaerales bacterium]
MLLAAEADHLVTLDLFVIFGVAALVAMSLHRLGMAIVPGYFLVGAIVGPGGLGLVESGSGIDEVSHLAVILLLFGIGMHLDLTVLKREAGPMLTAGVGSVIVTVLVLWPIALLFKLPGAAALVVAMAFSLSSTAVVLRIIAERRELRRPHGRMSLAILIVQDLLVIGMLASLPAIGAWSAGASGAELDTGSVTQAIGRALAAIGVVGVMVLAGVFILPRIVEEAARARSRELLTILGLAVALGASYTTQRLGFSAELGAFIGGVILSTTPFRHEMLGHLAGLRDVFMAVFFVAIGMSLDLAAIAPVWWAILAAGLVLGLVKAIVIGVAAWAVGVGGGAAIIIGLSLAQAGEFSILVLQRGERFGVLTENTAGLGVSIVVFTLFITPAIMAFGRWVAPRLSGHIPSAPWISSRAEESAITPDEKGEGRPHTAIVAGFGDIGRQVTAMLESSGFECVIVELNAFTVRTESRRGRRMIYGDISDPETLESAGADHATALVVTTPDDEATVRACRAARALSAELFIAARTIFPKGGKLATEAGADVVIVDERATGGEIERAIRQRFDFETPGRA